MISAEDAKATKITSVPRLLLLPIHSSALCGYHLVRPVRQLLWGGGPPARPPALRLISCCSLALS